MTTKITTSPVPEIVLNQHDEVDQILGRPPRWIIRWGLSLLLVAVLVFVSIAWMLKYPDTISAQAIIVTENPAIRVVAKASGKLERLFVLNDQAVSKGEIIALLESPSNLASVTTLSTFLERVTQIQDPTKMLSIQPPADLLLGNMQGTYAGLVQKIEDYRYFLKTETSLKKVQSLEIQIERIEQLKKNLLQQKASFAQELRLVKKDFNRTQQLNKEGVVSDIALETGEAQLLQAQRQYENLDNQYINHQISIEQLRTQILDLKQSRQDGRSGRELQISEDIERLKSEVELWTSTYLIKAPIAGQVDFVKVWSEQQFVQANQEVLTIVPAKGAGKIIGKAILPVANSGKVKPGQVANIRLNGFPYQEYGILQAEIGHISLVPVAASNEQEGAHYLLALELPDSLVTSYDKLIPFRQEMQGVANIITEDRRVLERIFERFDW